MIPAGSILMCIPCNETLNCLQQPNGNIAPDLRNSANICLQIELDVYLQAASDVFII